MSVRELESIEVMNGYIKPGDHIAYAVRQGSRHWMNIALVEMICESPRSSWDETLIVTVLVQVIQTTGYSEVPYSATITRFDRAVKLSPCQDKQGRRSFIGMENYGRIRTW